MGLFGVIDGAPRSRLWAWEAGQRKSALLCTVVSGMFAGYLVVYGYVLTLAALKHWSRYPFGDFFAFWSYARIATTHPAADLYDSARLHAAQLALGMNPNWQAPFPYPPPFLLMLRPLAGLSYTWAFLICMGSTLLVYALATSLGTQSRRLLFFSALLAPTTTVNIINGQTGFLSAALLIGGLRLVDRYPVVAGVLLGLLCYKPQFGLMVPVALLATRQWRCIVASGATVLTLAAAVTALSGIMVWADWLHALPAYEGWFDSRTHFTLMNPTVTANLRLLGCPPGLVALGQGAAILAGIVITWTACRRLPAERAVPAVVAATCLASPHSFVYDMPMLAGATFLFLDSRLRSGAALLLPEIAVLLLVLVLPAIMYHWKPHLPLSSPVIAAFLVLLLRNGAVLRDIRTAYSQVGPAMELRAQ